MLATAAAKSLLIRDSRNTDLRKSLQRALSMGLERHISPKRTVFSLKRRLTGGTECSQTRG